MIEHDARLLDFWTLALRLKGVRRQGWLDRGVRNAESSADHSWGVALLAWLLAHERADLNRDRLLLLGLVHDLPEAVAGDATPFDHDRDASGAIPPERFRELPTYTADARAAKREAEVAAIDTMLEGVPEHLRQEIRAAWEEYEAQVSPESRFIKQVDRLETLLQAEEYARVQPELVIESFWMGTVRDISDPALARLIATLRARPQE
jgi:putative hydrolases of HD superfamily